MDQVDSAQEAEAIKYESLHDLTAQAVTAKELGSELVSKIAAWTAASQDVVPDDDLKDDDLDDLQLPEVNWEKLEAQLRESALQESIKQVSGHWHERTRF